MMMMVTMIVIITIVNNLEKRGFRIQLRLNTAYETMLFFLELDT